MTNDMANNAIPSSKKERITIRLDSDILDAFRREEDGYQTRINNALREYLADRIGPHRDFASFDRDRLSKILIGRRVVRDRLMGDVYDRVNHKNPKGVVQVARELDRVIADINLIESILNNG